MRTNPFSYILIGLFCAVMAQAQGQSYTIKGIVKDAFNGQPISYANVAIWNSTQGAVTDSVGYFEITEVKPGNYRLQSTFIGYKTHGIPGAVFATAGMIFPSLVIIITIAAFIQQFAHLEAVQHAFAGIRIAVCALVLQSVWKMAKKGVVDVPTALILAVTFVAVAFLGISPVVMVIVAAGAGILIGLIRRRRA